MNKVSDIRVQFNNGYYNSSDHYNDILTLLETIKQLEDMHIRAHGGKVLEQISDKDFK